MGILNSKSIVKLEGQFGLIVFVLNCVLPGWGTVVSGILSKEVRCNNFILGFLQMMLSIILVGWLWSIYTGYMIWYKSSRE